MKKFVFIFLAILFLMAVSLSAQKKPDILFKFSKQENSMRVVLESEEQFINRMKVTTNPSQIKIDLPEPYNLISQKDVPFELIQSEKSLVMNLKEKGEIKFFRLSSPSRLVLDIKTFEMQSHEKQPAATEKPQTLFAQKAVFVIDAGHGGYDFGISSAGTSEKDITLNLAKDLGAALSKKGKKVFLIRRVDQYISLADRINFINQKNPDVFISLHSSLSQNFVLYSSRLEEESSNEMIDAYSLSSKQRIYIGKSKLLAESIGKAIKDELQINSVQREIPLPILNSVGAPSVFIEIPSPRFVAIDQQMKTKLINSIINGVIAYGQ